MGEGGKKRKRKRRRREEKKKGRSKVWKLTLSMELYGFSDFCMETKSFCMEFSSFM